MKMVSVKEKVKHDGATFYPGELRMVEDDVASYFCKHGWATAQDVESGDRVASDVKLEVQNGKHVNKGKTL